MDRAINPADTTSRYFQKIVQGLPEPIKVEIIKKCPKLLRIYGIGLLGYEWMI